MTFMEPVRVDGLRDLQRQLKAAENASPTMLRLALNDVSQIVVNVARPRIPTLTGTARSTLRAASTATSARVSVGGTKAPYYPWLDFGGAVGRHKSIRRPFIRSGRYIYPAYSQEHTNIMRLLEKRVSQVITNAGLDVSHGS